MSKYADSTGKPIDVGNTVKFRGKLYTIKCFGDILPTEVHPIYFNEEQHTTEVADEMSVDYIEG